MPAMRVQAVTSITSNTENDEEPSLPTFKKPGSSMPWAHSKFDAEAVRAYWADDPLGNWDDGPFG